MPILLRIEEVLGNNFLLADVLSSEEALKDLTLEELEALKEHFENKKNAKSFAAIFNTGLYAEYVKKRNKNVTLDNPINSVKDVFTEISGAAPVKHIKKTIEQALKHLQGVGQNKVETHVNEIEELLRNEMLEEVFFAEDRDEQLIPGEKSLAKKLAAMGLITEEELSSLQLFTQEELDEIFNP